MKYGSVTTRSQSSQEPLDLHCHLHPTPITNLPGWLPRDSREGCLKRQGRERPECRETEAAGEGAEKISLKHTSCRSRPCVCSQEVHAPTSGTDYGWMGSNSTIPLEASFYRHSRVSCMADHRIPVPQKERVHE